MKKREYRKASSPLFLSTQNPKTRRPSRTGLGKYYDSHLGTIVILLFVLTFISLGLDVTASIFRVNVAGYSLAFYTNAIMIAMFCLGAVFAKERLMKGLLTLGALAVTLLLIWEATCSPFVV